MKDVASSKKRLTESDQVKQRIKKKPMDETIGNTRFHYGLLEKKNQRFFGTNERLLIINTNKSIGYARTIPKETLLPFDEESNIPKLKKEIDLTKIQNVFAPN
jgi:hypothetical protein